MFIRHLKIKKMYKPKGVPKLQINYLAMNRNIRDHLNQFFKQMSRPIKVNKSKTLKMKN